MSQSEPSRTRTLEIQLPEHGFSKVMFCNRFLLHRSEDHLLACFGLVDQTGYTVDTYGCVFYPATIERNKEPIIEYFRKMGAMNIVPPPLWPLAALPKMSAPADVINMAHEGGMAEVALYVYSMHATTKIARNPSLPPTMIAQPLALLRCSIMLHQQFIKALYEV